DIALRRAAPFILSLTGGALNSNKWATLQCGKTDSVVAGVGNGLILGHNLSSGTAAAGLGSAVLFNLDSTTTADQNAAQISARWKVPTDASRGADVWISTVYNAGGLVDRFLHTQDGRFTLATAGQVNPDATELANSKA